MKLYVDKTIYTDVSCKQKCDRLAEIAGVSVEITDCSSNEKLSADDEVHLFFDGEGLSLVGNGQTFRGDYSGMLRRLTTNNLRSELLIKATKIKGNDSPLLIDATAGMGEDSLLLAAAGFRVRMYERNPVIAALLTDTLERAEGNPELSDAVSRMEVECADSIAALRQWVESTSVENSGEVLVAERPDVIYLDPMFPERQKSALVKKKFQLIHLLEEPCSDEEEMLQAAMAAGAHKIVIKRPLKGPYLSGVKPGFSLSGKAVRYDCIVLNG